MKLWIVLIIYFAVGIVNIFLWLLYLRLHGEDTKIYNLDDSDNFAIVSFLYLLTGITLPVVLLLYIYGFIKKYMIALIEMIVALKENEDGKDNN